MIFIDVETTGIDATKNFIISIGAIDFLILKINFMKNVK